MEYKIASIPGDGIGKEVMNEGLKVLEEISKLNKDIKFSVDKFDWGCEYYLENGYMMDKNGLKTLKNYDAILMGAVGYPNVPDHISLRELLLKIRQEFNQYINLRPIKLLPNVETPLKSKSSEDIDIIFVRENVEGEYAGVGDIYKENTRNEMAIQTSIFTRDNTEKLMKYAFNLTEKRIKNKLTSITKSNALNYSMVFWDKIFKEQSKKYPNIKTESIHVDAASMYMIQNPERFDVIVSSNLFGDILTDLGAALQGGLGFAAGANINPEKDYPSMFEPVHGSAPEISGKNIANPIAMIWSIKLMMDFLGHEKEGDLIMDAIIKSLENKDNLTPDLGGKGTTSKLGDIICENLSKEINKNK
jgi:tartrate dehydrogenase/decarboxylase/D-malate dehydrogenase